MGRSRTTPASGHGVTEAIVVPPAPERLERPGASECWCERRVAQRRPLSRQASRRRKGYGDAAFQELGK